ncbi:hypothetical protein Tco_1201335 [Tanacetum coccineum]
MFTLGAASVSFDVFSFVAVFMKVVTMGVVLAIALILLRVIPSVGPHSMIQMRWTYVTGQYVIAPVALGCIVPDVRNNVTEIITPADAALSENDFHLVKNYTTSTRVKIWDLGSCFGLLDNVFENNNGEEERDG